VSAIDEIKFRISVREALEDVGARIRPRNRADCVLCKGSQTGTISYKDNVWHCHRCQRGGNVFDLIKFVHKCSFRSALEYLAHKAEVQLDEPHNASEAARLRRETKQRKRERERIDALCAESTEQERNLRLECRRQLHLCDGILALPAPWDEDQWSLAVIAHELSSEHLAPEYTLLSFGAADVTTRYVMAGDVERAQMLSDVFWRGGARSDDGHFVEVVE
jgi:hypothetical protein